MSSKHILRNLPTNFEKIKSETRERKRNMLYLILGYLSDNALDQTAETLITEANLDMNYQVCENVELDVILQEYQSYYYTKFQKYPRIVRKLEKDEKGPTVNRRGKSAKRTAKTPSPPKESPPSETEDFQFEIISLNNNCTTQTNCPPKPKPCFLELENYTTDNKELINQISNQVIVRDINAQWSDCVGLEHAIELLKESTIYPIEYPELFIGLEPWRGILLHGPPGTGKTLLAKSLAAETQTTFFNVTSSTFISKWRGESEKLIKNLFDVAKLHAPSTIFFDEIDALMPPNKESQHEASKRFKSQLLVELDGLSSENSRIFVLASTNSPWELDNALLRRFDKRIFIDMPSREARINILKNNLNMPVKLSVEELGECGNLTENFSGSDVKNVAKEVCMSLVRENIKRLKGVNKRIETRQITFGDIKLALQKIRPTISTAICKKYYQWQNEHGAI
ncbi:katanin p60 ATPase-containing subunit A-like 2 [Anthonomus grandis grandis]|uniref:katanin p60 ATPase-containing subunit A-like 2 n=1 Tax=Anthonomus grandis grandis TaxID=2921223 RepID=UPI0021669C43|nr:katanin p60 ATPase-containing subunit A-like 2 [Anthonomus grandis grandis]